MSTSVPISRTAHSPTLDGDETMRQAVDLFRTRMEAANRKFIIDRISEIFARGLATEEERIRLMQQWRHFELLGCGGGDDSSDPHARSLGNQIRQTRQLAAIPTLLEGDTRPLFAMGGLYPPLLCTREARQIFLDTLQEVFQRQADEWSTEEGENLAVIPRCEELGQLLAYTHAIEDPDFRQSGIAPFEAGLSVLNSVGSQPCLDTPEQRDQYHSLVRNECRRLRERLETKDTSDLINKALIGASPDIDLDVRAGVVMGTGYAVETETRVWYSTYLYCRLDPDEDAPWLEESNGSTPNTPNIQNALNIPDSPNIHEWGWRVVFIEEEGDGVLSPQVLNGRRPRFDSIPEFLDWYASWPDHLDARGLLSLRRHAVGCDTDCESECEEHNLGEPWRP